ncbi:sensor histidine kinase [Paenibacillus sp. YN15]|uniref:sensor histidine kinase n=1 Tax=Paenibacillus sp. YN15 TaxID=1742774 RepID=UPI0015EBDD94|nr:histidine kinase [Paenibacillus sp. YN15]
MAGMPTRSFSRRLVMRLSLVIMTAFLLSGYISYIIHVRLFTDEVSKQFFKANEQAASRLDLQIRDIYRISNSVVFHPYVQEVLKRSAAMEDREAITQIYDQKELDKQLLQVKLDENKLYTMYLFDAKDNGFYFTTSNTAPRTLDRSIYGEVKWKLANSMGNVVWFPTVVREAGGEYGERGVYVAARYMKDLNQRQYGIMVMLFEESLFSEDLNGLVGDEKANVFLYDKQEKLVYSDLKAAGEAPDPAALPSGSVVEDRDSGYLYLKSRSGQMDFTLISRVSLNELERRSPIIYQTSIVVGLIGVAVASILVNLTGNRLLAPLRQLVSGMRRMREGDFDTRLTVRTDDELGFISGSFNDMAQNIKTLISEVYERQLNAREAELTALQAQLNPHFLYNTLDTIYWNIYLKNDKQTAKLVVSLSNMLRYALEPVDTYTTLNEEMTQTRNYLAIQSSRFGEDLEIMIQVDEEIAAAPVPRLILQPLVENAFVHGFANKAESKVLIIRAFRLPREKTEAMRIEIIDNGKGMAEEEVRELLAHAEEPAAARLSPVQGDDSAKRKVPIGLRNVTRRIHLLYGHEYGVDIESKPNAGTAIRLTLPLHEGRSGGKETGR